MAGNIQQNDIGTRFLITVKDDGVAVDLTTASLRQLVFRKPDDTKITRNASLIGDGSGASGVMYYDTVAGDLDQKGRYKLQGQVTIPSGTYYTDVYSFSVKCNL